MQIEPCLHEETVLAKRAYSNGAEHFGKQCLKCGDWTSAKKPSFTESLKAVAYDPAIRDQYAAEVQRRFDLERAEVERKRQQQNAAWWAAYSAYLLSDRWRSKRDRVLKRDNGLCQACLTRQASQVHHLTYDHCQNAQGEFGYEPLFDLESICEICHRALTKLDRERRAS